MTQLKIVTVEYEGKRLEDLGDGIVSVLNPLLSGFRLGEALSSRDLDKDVLIELYGQPPSFAINGTSFLNYLARLGEPILAITSLPAIILGDSRGCDSDYHTIYGLASRQLPRTAFISVGWDEFGKTDSDNNIERIIKEATHEIGHCFGLRDHRKEMRTSTGKLCPMSTSHDNSPNITHEQYLSSRDTIYCTECYSLLGISEPAPSK